MRDSESQFVCDGTAVWHVWIADGAMALLLVIAPPVALAATRRYGLLEHAAQVVAEVKQAQTELSAWTARRSVPTPPALLPGTSYVQPEPLGVVCIIAPWNFPVALLLNPLVAAIAAGNAAVLKPSEVSPACAALMGTLIPRYLDTDAVRVVQGAVAETTGEWLVDRTNNRGV